VRTWLLVLVVLAGCDKLLGIEDPHGNVDGSSGGDGTSDGDGDGGNGDAPPACAMAPTFGAEVSIDLGGTGTMIAFGDLNNDGKLDVAVAIGTSVVILHGDGAGGLGTKQTVATAATGVAIADFDIGLDGDDLVMWTVGGNTVIERNQIGGGNFDAEQPLTGPFTNVTRVKTGIIDVLSVPDLVVEDSTARRVFTDNQITPGTFTREATTVGGAGDDLITLEDVNNDKGDATMVGGGVVKIALSDPNNVGGFLTPITVGSGVTGNAVAYGNFDGDLAPDLIFATNGGGVVFLQSESSRGTFTQKPGKVAGVVGSELQVIDVNNDGRPDVLTPTHLVLQCPPPAAFGTFGDIIAINAASPSALVDLNNDNKPDLVRVEGTSLKVRIQQ
jgi:FG-GAP-like repeat